MSDAKASRRDSKRRSKREDHRTGFAAYRYYRDANALASAKLRGSIFRDKVRKMHVSLVRDGSA